MQHPRNSITRLQGTGGDLERVHHRTCCGRVVEQEVDLDQDFAPWPRLAPPVNVDECGSGVGMAMEIPGDVGGECVALLLLILCFLGIALFFYIHTVSMSISRTGPLLSDGGTYPRKSEPGKADASQSKLKVIENSELGWLCVLSPHASIQFRCSETHTAARPLSVHMTTT